MCVCVCVHVCGVCVHVCRVCVCVCVLVCVHVCVHVCTQDHYNGPRKWQQNGGHKSTLNNIPCLRSEGIMMDCFCHSYQ